MIDPARSICDDLLRILGLEPDTHPLSLYTVRYFSSNIYGITGSIALERNQGAQSLEAKEHALRLKQEAQPVDAGKITIAKASLGLGEIFFGDRRRGHDLLVGCIEEAGTNRDQLPLKSRWLANLALSWLMEGNLDKALTIIISALDIEEDRVERARYVQSPRSLPLIQVHSFHYTKGSCSAFFTKGRILYQMGSVCGAQTSFEMCLQLRWQMIPSHFHVAVAQHKLGTLPRTANSRGG
jgi:tetratricopeptide (TPR) repeat protein